MTSSYATNYSVFCCSSVLTCTSSACSLPTNRNPSALQYQNIQNSELIKSIKKYIGFFVCIYIYMLMMIWCYHQRQRLRCHVGFHIPDVINVMCGSHIGLLRNVAARQAIFLLVPVNWRSVACQGWHSVGGHYFTWNGLQGGSGRQTFHGACTWRVASYVLNRSGLLEGSRTHMKTGCFTSRLCSPDQANSNYCSRLLRQYRVFITGNDDILPDQLDP